MAAWVSGDVARLVILRRSVVARAAGGIAVAPVPADLAPKGCENRGAPP